VSINYKTRVVLLTQSRLLTGEKNGKIIKQNTEISQINYVSIVDYLGCIFYGNEKKQQNGN